MSLENLGHQEFLYGKAQRRSGKLHSNSLHSEGGTRVGLMKRFDSGCSHDLARPSSMSFEHDRFHGVVERAGYVPQPGEVQRRTRSRAQFVLGGASVLLRRE